MTRFELLALMERFRTARSVPELARASRQAGHRTNLFRAALHAQLRRMHRWRLVDRRWKRGRNSHGGSPQPTYRLNAQGRERLMWARSRGLL